MVSYLIILAYILFHFKLLYICYSLFVCFFSSAQHPVFIRSTVVLLLIMFSSSAQHPIFNNSTVLFVYLLAVRSTPYSYIVQCRPVVPAIGKEVLHQPPFQAAYITLRLSMTTDTPNTSAWYTEFCESLWHPTRLP